MPILLPVSDDMIVGWMSCCLIGETVGLTAEGGEEMCESGAVGGGVIIS